MDIRPQSSEEEAEAAQAELAQAADELDAWLEEVHLPAARNVAFADSAGQILIQGICCLQDAASYCSTRVPKLM